MQIFFFWKPQEIFVLSIKLSFIFLSSSLCFQTVQNIKGQPFNIKTHHKPAYTCTVHYLIATKHQPTQVSQLANIRDKSNEMKTLAFEVLNQKDVLLTNNQHFVFKVIVMKYIYLQYIALYFCKTYLIQGSQCVQFHSLCTNLCQSWQISDVQILPFELHVQLRQSHVKLLT